MRSADPHTFTLAQAAPLIAFVDERHAAYLRKSIKEGSPPPEWADPEGWYKHALSAEAEFGLPAHILLGVFIDGSLTTDPILQQYKFTNVFRELDRVTVWIREHIREPFAEHEHLWWMLMVARTINWPPTLQCLMDHLSPRGDITASWPDLLGFDPSQMTPLLEHRRFSGEKVETGAYLIRAESHKTAPWYSWSKQRYVSEIVLGRPWADQCKVVDLFNQPGLTLQEAWQNLTVTNSGLAGQGLWTGWGPFMAGQVVADLRHTRYLKDAPDVGRWAPLGPGSRRGLNRLAGRNVGAALSQEAGLAEMLQLQALVNEHSAGHVPVMELHDVQNVCCEVDKYLRVKGGEGRPRALYRPFGGEY